MRKRAIRYPLTQFIACPDCILEAARSLGTRALAEAAETINSEQMASMLPSGGVFVERVREARERKLREAIRQFQNESDANDA